METPRQPVLTGNRDRLMAAAVACIAVGVAAITVGVLAGWEWTRIIGAATITAGGGMLGALIALHEPQRRRLQATMDRNRVVIALVAAVILVLPVVFALVAAVVGLFTGGGDRNAALLALGVVVGLCLLAASVISMWIAIQATRRTIPIGTEDAHGQTGEAT